MLHIKQRHRSELHLSTLSLQDKGIQMINIGLVCDRGCKLQEVDNIFIANNIIDLHLVGGGSYIFPLYCYKKA